MSKKGLHNSVFHLSAFVPGALFGGSLVAVLTRDPLRGVFCALGATLFGLTVNGIGLAVRRLRKGQ